MTGLPDERYLLKALEIQLYRERFIFKTELNFQNTHELNEIKLFFSHPSFLCQSAPN